MTGWVSSSMKALVLSAGFGTRLNPHSLEVPKPLFPVCGRPIIDIIICRLIRAGVTGIAINTHYKADLIASFLTQQHYGAEIDIRFEPRLLGTGGAVGSFSDFLSDAPFIVINSDVLTDIDFRTVYGSHTAGPFPATMVMHDHPLFNKVSVSGDGRVHGFSGKVQNDHQLLAFTGISIISPAIYAYIAPGEACCIIDVYRRMIRAGETIAAHIVSGHYWNDLGTPERYRDAVADHMVPRVFETIYGKPGPTKFHRKKLAGDGSDRKWYRVTGNGHSLVMADHGIHAGHETAQVDAFVAIGRHLAQAGIPVPEIFDADRFSGLVLMQDLGDTALQDVAGGPNVLHHYRRVIDILVQMSVMGKNGFDPAWAYEGTAYDRQMIIERECRYFTGSFLKGYLGFDAFPGAALADCFEHLAASIAANGYDGLMHRDFQSRNIMVANGACYVIDFQGARFGPVQYDLAALLSDPYVGLDRDVRESLLDHAADAMADHPGTNSLDRARFIRGYRYCCISRLMQALGAFGFLSRVKQKKWFEQYIPMALETLEAELKRLPDTCGDSRLAALSETVSSAAGRLHSAMGQSNGKAAGQTPKTC